LQEPDPLRFRGFVRSGELLCILDRKIDVARPEFVSLLDRASGTGLHWIRDPEESRYHLCKTPMHDLLRWWTAPRDSWLLHAGAVGRDDGGVLIAGRSGAGKTITSLSCLGSPMRFAGDDVCLVSMRDGSPRVHSLYGSAAVNHADLEWFPHLAPLHANADRPDEKPLLALLPAWSEHLIREFPLRAIVLPHVVPGTAAPRLAAATRGEALLGLGPTSVLQFRGSGHPELRGIADIIRSVPAYRLEIGPDRDAIPDVIASLL